MSDSDGRPLFFSSFAQIVSNDNWHMAYHALLGSYQVLDDSGLATLAGFPPSGSEKGKCLTELPNISTEIARKLVGASLIEASEEESRSIASKDAQTWLDQIEAFGAFESLGLILTQECNLACTYCVRDRAIENARLTGAMDVTAKHMSRRTSEETVDRYAQQIASSGTDSLHVSFNGSEPLVNSNTLVHVMNYTEQKYGGHYDVSFHVNTNGTLVTKEIAERLGRSQTTVYTSLDGPKEVHDRQRPSKAGKGSFDVAVRGQRLLRDQGIPINGFLTVITKENIDRIDKSFLEYMAYNGLTVLTLEPDMLSIAEFTPQEMAHRLVDIHQLGMAMGIKVRGSWYRAFSTLLSQRGRRVPLTPYCGSQAGRSMTVDPDGNVMLCDFSSTPIGHIRDLESCFEAVPPYVWKRFPGNIETCRGCQIEGLCRGGCGVVAENASIREQHDVWSYRCDVYRAATRKLIENFLKETVV